ncbi:hypothetical protein [Komagataeibacter xylinus]|uniref:hypothetical protein n=1 Tax=Komagataeibacter xylinus TaxID=28448 RepID=UPI00280BADF0|nr:hypothetical protein [Komagataeibacter xylinus]
MPSSQVVSIIGNRPFSSIVRRRKRFGAEIQAAAESAQYGFQILETDEAAFDLANHIENRAADSLYVILPSCIAPLYMPGLVPVLKKCAFALETMFLAPISGDEAPVLLKEKDAIAFLRAKNAEGRRNILLGLAETAPSMVDQLGMVDLRKPRNLFKFLIGSTEARHFNDTEAVDGIFHKSSSDIAKMEGEYSYFHVAPEEMKRFLMPTFHFWKKDGRAGYSMEHLPVPDVALQFIHNALQPADFDLLLDNFFAFLSSRKKGMGNVVATREEGRRHILGKLDARIDSFLNMKEGRKLDAILAASGPRGDIRTMLADARPFIEKALEQWPDQHLVFGHGDPCFSNILFDKRLGLMRLIDPKGAVSFEAGLMHPSYDIAKFSHSVMGGYDFINNGLFNCFLNDQLVLECQLDAGGPPAWAQERFTRHLNKAGIDIVSVRAVELSLFLSMLPLHSDRPKKLAGFALTAAAILDDLECRK